MNAYKGRIYAEVRATFGNRPEGKTAKDRKGRQLYDMLIKDLIESVGVATGFQVDPSIKFGMFKKAILFESAMEILDLDKMNLKQTTYIYNAFRRWINEGKKLGVYSRDIVPPLRAMLGKEKTGLAAQLIERTEALSDRSRQRYVPYKHRNDEILANLDRAIDQVVSAVIQSERGFNIGELVDTFLLDPGLYGVIGPKGYASILSHKDGKYKIKYLSNDSEATVSEKDLNLDNVELGSVIRETYKRFMYELLHGRTRYVRLQGIDSLQNIPEHDYKIGEKIINEMKEYAKAKMGMHPNVHTLVGKRGIKYKYILVKKEGAEREVGEIYNAYIIQEVTADGEITNTWSGYEVTPELSELFEDGYYRAEKNTVFSVPQERKAGVLEWGTQREYTDFRRMKNQPRIEIMGKSMVQKRNLWSAVSDFRKLLGDIRKDFETSIKEEKEIWTEIVKQYSKTSTDSLEEINKTLNKVAGISGSLNKLWVGKYGDIFTPNSWFRAKEMNYFPVQQKDDEIFDSVDEAIKKLRVLIANEELKSQESRTEEERDAFNEAIAKLVKDIKGLEALSDAIRNNSNAISDKHDLSFVNKAVHLKHRGTLLDYTKIRLDDDVLPEYMDSSYRILETNKLKASLLETLQYIEDPEIKDWLINRVKVAIGDKDTTGRIGPIDLSHEKMANLLNTVPLKMLRKIFQMEDKKFTPDMVYESIVAQNAFNSSVLLRSRTSFRNNFQRINTIARWGMKLQWEAITKATDPYWQKVVEETGVLNLINMLNDVLIGVSGDQLYLRDAISFNIAGTKLPNVLGAGVDITALKMITRPKFISKGHKSIDRVLNLLIKHAKRRNEIIDLTKARQYYWEILNLDEKARRPNLAPRIAYLLKGVKESKRNAVLDWSLNWFWGKKGPWTKIFTIGGGEQQMRTESAIMGILARERTLGLTPVKPGEDMYRSPEAMQAARMAVFSTMFGMSQPYLPDAFGGYFRFLLQYKPYMYHQIVHDTRLVRNWYDTMDQDKNFAARWSGGLFDLTKALNPLYSREPNPMATALAAAAFGRFFSVAYYIGIEILFKASPLSLGYKTGKTIYSLFGRGSLGSGIRGAEEPVMGLLIKWAFWYFFASAFHNDDDDDKDKERYIREFMGWVIPVGFMWPVTSAMDTYELFSD